MRKFNLTKINQKEIKLISGGFAPAIPAAVVAGAAVLSAITSKGCSQSANMMSQPPHHEEPPHAHPNEDHKKKK